MAFAIIQKDYTYLGRVKWSDIDGGILPVDDMGYDLNIEDHFILDHPAGVIFPFTTETFSLNPVPHDKPTPKYSIWDSPGLVITDSSGRMSDFRCNLFRGEFTSSNDPMTLNPVGNKTVSVISPWKEYSRQLHIALTYEKDVLKVLHAFWQAWGFPLHMSPIKIPTEILTGYTKNNDSIRNWFADPHNYKLPKA